MNLPCDRPIMPLRQFSEYQVPKLVVNLPDTLAAAAPRATAMLLNAAQEKATLNPARMLSLNMLSVNEYRNQSLVEWVDLTLRLSALIAISHNAPQNFIAYLPEAVDKALLFLTSLTLVNNANLANNVSFDSRSAANQNVAEFSKVRQNLYNVNLQAFTGQTKLYQDNVTSPMTSPMLNNYSHQFASAHENSGAIPTSQWGNLDTPQTKSWDSNPLSQSSLGNNSEVVNGNDWALPAANQTSATVAPAVVPLQVQQAPVIQQPSIPKQTYQCATARGENEMDINNHSLPYFGSNIALDMSTRRDDLRLEAMQIGREGRRPETSSDPILLDRGLVTDVSFDSALFTTRLAMFKNKHNGFQNKIYRNFICELNPVPCTDEAKIGMEMFEKATNMEQLPGLFRNFLLAFRDPSNPGEDEQLALNLYTYLDFALAKAVNDFMFFNLRLSEPRISSFSEGIEPLLNFLRTQRGEKYVLAFQAWMSRFLDSLKANINPENDNFLSEYFNEDQTPSFGYVPLIHSVTLTNLTAKELDYKADRTGSLIDPKVTMTLAELAQTLHRNKKDLGIFSAKDWLVTADDHRFRIAEDALEPGRYYIFKL